MVLVWRLDVQDIPVLLHALQEHVPPLEVWSTHLDTETLRGLVDVQQFSSTYNSPQVLELLSGPLAALRAALEDAARRLHEGATMLQLTTQQLVYLLYWCQTMVQNPNAPADMERIGLGGEAVRSRLEKTLRETMLTGVLAAGVAPGGPH